MSWLRVVLLVLFLVPVVNVNADSGQETKIVALETLEAWNQAVNNHDAATFSRLFTFDVVLLTSYQGSTLKSDDQTGEQIFISDELTAVHNLDGALNSNSLTIMERQYDGSWRTRFLNWN